jgi:DNA-binding PadR family transcriptional regulator
MKYITYGLNAKAPECAYMQFEPIISADIDIEDAIRIKRAYEAQNCREILLRNLQLYSFKTDERGFNVLAERIEFRILKKLLKIGRANVYEISKSSRDIGHYSTVLRALRRMEKKNIVQSVSGISSGRKTKIYEVTLLGELIESLGTGGWKLTAEKIAKRSSKFKDCQEAHKSFDQHYYWIQTSTIIENLMRLSENKDLPPNLEELVMESEFVWIKTNLIERLNDRKERSEKLDFLEKLSNIDWIFPIIIRYINEYTEEWREWLKNIDNFKQKLLARAT